MATSYANTGGTGDRRAIITVTDSGGLIVHASSNWIDGSLAGVSYWQNAVSLSGSVYLRFDFGSGASKIIDEVQYYQDSSVPSGQGTWQWQGSNDASSWTNIGSSFALGATGMQTITALSGNTTGYRYYQIIGVSGSTNDTPYVLEFEFKIDDATGSSFIASWITA